MAPEEHNMYRTVKAPDSGAAWKYRQLEFEMRRRPWKLLMCWVFKIVAKRFRMASSSAQLSAAVWRGRGDYVAAAF